MSAAAIEIHDIGKQYRIGEEWRASAIREKLANPRELFRRAKEARHVWAVRHATFDIEQGSVVGLIGRNGAGKSTLLKILSRITLPTEGEVRLYGRVASLLEVGTGFHPELTGRENIFLNGAILGMSRAEIVRKFDSIVEFSGITELLDTPVKRFSSGMFVRLAFAVAAHLDPEILLVDEVLAVGDAAFQRKCIGQMEQIAGEGRTVVVVSHNMNVVTQLCKKAAWLDGGRVVEYGPAQEVIGHYLAAGVENQIVWQPTRHDPQHSFLLHEVAIVAATDAYDAFAGDQPITITFDFTVAQPVPPGRLSFLVRALDGLNVLSSASSDGEATLNHAWSLGRQRMRCTIPGGLLRPGQYFVTVAVPVAGEPIVYENVLTFLVTEQNSLASRDGRTSTVVPRLPWTLEAVS